MKSDGFDVSRDEVGHEEEPLLAGLWDAASAADSDAASHADDGDDAVSYGCADEALSSVDCAPMRRWGATGEQRVPQRDGGNSAEMPKCGETQ